MTYRGRVKDGVIVVEGPDKPPEGAEMSMRVLKPRTKNSTKPRKKRGSKEKTFAERMKKFIGMGSHLPPDFSVNHDHYLYGTPKKGND